MSDENKEKIVWGDIDHMPRDKCESAFKFTRERIYAQLIELDTSIKHVNIHRFVENPIVLDLDFRTQLTLLNDLPFDEQTPIRNLATEKINGWVDEGLL